MNVIDMTDQTTQTEENTMKSKNTETQTEQETNKEQDLLRLEVGLRPTRQLTQKARAGSMSDSKLHEREQVSINTLGDKKVSSPCYLT